MIAVSQSLGYPARNLQTGGLVYVLSGHGQLIEGVTCVRCGAPIVFDVEVDPSYLRDKGYVFACVTCPQETIDAEP